MPTTGGDALIDVSDLALSIRGAPVLNRVNLRMREGEIYGLLGPNGAGKSTTLSVLTGLRVADSGNVLVLGLDPARQGRELRGKIGVLAENSGFYDWMSASEYLVWTARLYGREPAADEIARHLKQVGLVVSPLLRIGAFSRGMKQRLGLARALLNAPRLLLLDEPTHGLDPRGRREIHDVLLTLTREAGVGILLCTHLLDDVERLCGRIGIIARGRTLLEDDLASALARRSGAARYRLRLAGAYAPLAETLPGGAALERSGDGWADIELGEHVTPETVWRALYLSGWPIVEIEQQGDGLEELYLDVTEMRTAA